MFKQQPIFITSASRRKEWGKRNENLRNFSKKYLFKLETLKQGQRKGF